MHVCLFDIDGTLLSSGGAGKAAMEAALAAEFGVTRPIERMQLSGRTDRAITKDVFAVLGIEDTPHNLQRFLSGYLRHLPACLKSHRGEVLPGIAPLLELLNTRPYTTVGLLTGNLRDGARLKLEHYRIHQHFAFGGYGDHHLDRDDVAREALDAARVHLDGSLVPERVWVIGDTPLDIRCARAVGARVVAVATGWHSLDELAADRPDLLLNDLSDPAPLLDMLG